MKNKQYSKQIDYSLPGLAEILILAAAMPAIINTGGTLMSPKRQC